MSVGLLMKLAADDPPASVTLPAATRAATEAKQNVVDAKTSAAAVAPTSVPTSVVGEQFFQFSVFTNYCSDLL